MNELKEAIGSIAKTGYGANYLKFRKNSLPTFPAFLLDGLDVTHLIAHHCNISSIEETAFFGLSDKLESIDLSENVLTKVILMTIIDP